jgi:hypothetical protein
MYKLSALFALLATLTGGCNDHPQLQAQLKPGVSTGFDVREAMGAPSMEWKNTDGSTTWEFTRMPAGKKNYMATVGADNILREFVQVVTEENFGKVRAGMTKDELRRLLGKPTGTMRLPLKPEDVWSWAYDDVFPREMFFDVSLDNDGKVIGSGRHDEHRG